MNLAECLSALQHPNVRAFLRVIREGETNQEDYAYRMMYGGALFPAPPWAHPYDGIPTTQGAKACGAYQFLGTTWHNCAKTLGLQNFSPASQDAAAVYLIHGRGALEDVEAGNIVLACRKLREEWVSLDSMSLQRAQEVFLKYGGSTTPQEIQPEAPIEDRGVPYQSPESPMLPALALIGPILQAIPSLISALGKGDQAQKNAKAAEVVVSAFTAGVPGAVNAQDAIERAQADPAVMAQAKAAVLADPTVVALMEVGSGGIGGARKAMTDLIAASPNASWKVVFNPLLIITLAVLPLVYIVVWELVKYMGKVSPDVIAQTIGTVIGLVLGSACGFWFGQTYQSNSVRRSTDGGQQ